MVLEHEGQLIWSHMIRWALLVRGRAHDGDVILHQYAVVNNCDVRRPAKLAVRFEPRSVKDDVVGLPLAGGARGVHEWRVLPVDRSRLPVRVSDTLVGVEHLDLIKALQEDPTVATVLVSPCGGLGVAHSTCS